MKQILKTSILFFITVIFVSCTSQKKYAELEERYRENQNVLNKNLKKLNELTALNEVLSNQIQNLKDMGSQMAVKPSESKFYENINLLNDKSFSEIDLNKVETDTISNCLSNKPKTLSALNSGSTKFVYTIDENTTNSASLLGLISGKLDKNERIAVVDYVEYKDLHCGNAKKLRVAAGVRLTLKIKATNNKFKINIPSKVAAASEFGIAEVTYRIETIGFKNSTTRKILSNLGGEFNVDDYVKVLNAVNQIQMAMDSVDIVDPRIIPIETF